MEEEPPPDHRETKGFTFRISSIILHPMAIDPEVLARVNGANPFGRGSRVPTNEERTGMKIRIAALRAENLTYLEIAREIGIGYNLIWDWKAQDPEFRELLDAAEKHLTQELEKAALNRAINGTRKPVVNSGRVVMDPTNNTKPLLLDEYDNRLTEFMLKGRMRETYGDKVQTDANINLRGDQAIADLDSRIAALAEAERAQNPAASSGDESSS